MNTAEAKDGQGIQRILKDNAELAEVAQNEVQEGQQRERGRYSMLARYSGTEAATILRIATCLDGVESTQGYTKTIVLSVTRRDGVGSWSRLHANCSRRTPDRMSRARRERMLPECRGRQEPSVARGHAMGRKVVEHDGGTRTRREDSRTVANVGAVGDLRQGGWGTDADAFGRTR